MTARIAHVALWTRDLDAAAAFWRDVFNARIGEPYASARRVGFVSRFVTLGEGATIELMTGPWVGEASRDENEGWDHIAVSLGSQAQVDRLAARCAREGRLVSAPRMTGDGFYEAVIAAPDGTRVEITS
jgi:lactoylglutathione lyase